MEQSFELIAKTFMGLEPVLAKELTQLGANDVKIGRRMVSFTGDKELMYRANFAISKRKAQMMSMKKSRKLIGLSTWILIRPSLSTQSSSPKSSVIPSSCRIK